MCKRKNLKQITIWEIRNEENDIGGKDYVYDELEDWMIEVWREISMITRFTMLFRTVPIKLTQ